MCAVRNFYADDGAVCRGSISEQHPLDFQGFRIDSNSAPRRNFTPFLVRDILVPACPARNIASAASMFSSFSYFCPDIVPLLGLTTGALTEINDRFIRSRVRHVVVYYRVQFSLGFHQARDILRPVNKMH